MFENLRLYSLLALAGICPQLLAVPAEIAESDFACARQEYGETRKGKSVDGNALTLAGKVYTSGIGTHATSMIPIDVPEFEDGVRVFTGVVGVDDEVTAGIGDGVECRILSGTEVLWTSGVIRRGEPKTFRVAVPQGARKLYLLALAVGNNWNDHVDWVNLKFEAGANAALGTSESDPVYRGEDYGLVPGTKDATPALRKLLKAVHQGNGGGKIVLPKGDYHFYPQSALEMSFHVSNHEQPTIHPVQISLSDLRDLELDGNGSNFIFHGKSLALLLMDCENVRIRNLKIDYARAPYSEAKVVGFEDGKTVVTIDEKAFPYMIRNGQLRFFGEGWQCGVGSVIAFRAGTKEIVERTSDIGYGGRAEARADGKVNLLFDFSKVGAGVAVGDTLTLRTWSRPHPACVIYRAKNTSLENVSIHSGWGMALLAQRSHDIRISGGGTFPRAETGRVYSASADAFHFSNVSGEICIENAFFETMMDDALNVHSTCLSVEDVPAPNQIRCRYKHSQAVGFEVFLPGETLRFIQGPTLEQKDEIKVKQVRKLNTNELLITLEKDVPAGLGKGDAVENADFQPSVIFRNNTVQNNRARGILLTTPRKVVVKNNTFKTVAGAAILLAGDAQGWYESGPCEDVEISGNRFLNNLTSSFQFTEAIIALYPEVRNLSAQKQYYHRNVRISDNEFETFDVPLLFAISSEKLSFTGNRIRYNNHYRGWNKKPFIFRRCKDVCISGNTVAPLGAADYAAQTWTLEDVRLEKTPADTVKFRAE